MASPTDASGNAALAAQMVEALMRFQELHRDMTVLQARAFFAVAATPGQKQATLLKSLGGSDSALSRVMAVLGPASRVVKAGRASGLGLVEVKINPHDTREKLLNLTKRGQRLFEDIAHDLSPVRRGHKSGGISYVVGEEAQQ